MSDTEKKNSEEQKMRSVMLASPSHDGKVDVWHAAALAETCKIGVANGINVIPIYMSYDALVQRARNDIFKLAADSKVDDLVFIDCDQDWYPMDFFKLLSHDVEVVGAPVPKKSDMESYNVKLTGEWKVEDNGLAIVDSVGTGFLRIRADAIAKIIESSKTYKEPHKEEPTPNVFEVTVKDDELISEDVTFCNKWTELGGKVYIDPTINAAHTGVKRWVGNFYEWIKLARRR
jgi:hypothetical protein